MSGKIVILEGPDASGKTTFANFLSEEYGYEYHHEGVPPSKANLFEYYGRQLLDAYVSGRNHVFDRQWLGQLVYGPIHRNDAAISATPFMRLVYGWDVKMFIFNSKDYEGQLFIWEKRNGIEHIKDKDILLKCWHAWNATAEDFPLIPVFDYKLDDYNSLMEIINLDFDSLPPHMIGSPSAEYLFVGESANSDVLDLPFFTSLGSSGYLNKALESAGFKENEIAFVNAMNTEGEPVYWYKDLMGILPNLHTIVCLGERAYQATPPYRECTIIKAPHPAYWSRFRHNQLSEYVNLIKPRVI